MKRKIITTMAALACCSAITTTMAQKNRAEIEQQYTWNLEDLYPTREAWAEAKAALVEKAKAVENYKGTLGRSAADLLGYFEFVGNIDKDFTRLAVYAMLNSDVDVSDADNLALTKELDQAAVDYNMMAAFARAELAAIPQETIDQFVANEPKLKQYAMDLDRIARGRVHTLSPAEEELMAKTDILGDVPSSTFNIFSNAEMPFPTITLESGEEVELNQAAFSQLRASANKADREKAFYAFWNTYKKYEGTMGELMNGNVKQNIFYAKVRKYDSALDAALYRNNIPTSVYHSLVDNVNRCLPTFHRYLALKQKLMNLDTLKYSDLYAPAVKDVELNYTYDEAKQMVLEAIKPLGEEYASVVRTAFDNRWIDVYPNKGKRTGAYSCGSAYDVHPYILMNYQDQYEQVGTLIHELGHTMHSYFSNKHQTSNNADYSIFVAEVASTFNEALLDHLMMQKLTDKGQKISLLMNILDGFKGTLFRQTQFAEFELAMHEKAERGEPLTGKVLTALYLDIVRRYYGHDQKVCVVDDCVGHEWEFVPHFYRSFYVYQYSTSFVASQALSEMVLSGDEVARDRYLHFLTTGGSMYPIDILKEAGVDMTTSDPFDKAIEKMNKVMDQIEELMK